MYAPAPTAAPGQPSPGRDAVRNARYAYLVGRLQNRQMTMEEATELFTIMQGMLQTSEAARAALARAAVPPPVIPGQVPPPARPAPAPVSGTSDDLFLVGLLAMGAGAGLLAALSKRIQDGASPPAGGGLGSSGASSTSPKR